MSGVLVALPLLGGGALVMHSEPPGREPPLDRPTNCGAAAPAVGVATTLAVARIVHTLDDAPAHSTESRLQPIRCRAREQAGWRQT